MKDKKAKTAVKKPQVKKEEISGKELEKEEIREIVEDTIETLLKEKTTEQNDTEKLNNESEKPAETEGDEIPVEREKMGTEILPPEKTSTIVTTSEVTADTEPNLQIDSQKNGAETQQDNKTDQAEGNEKAVQTPIDSPTATSPVTDIKPESVFQTSPEIPMRHSSKLPLFIFLLVLVILLAGGGYFVLSRHIISLPKNTTLPFIAKPTPTPAPEVVPTATPTPQKLNLSDYTISVLNGSGVTGAASKAKSYLVSQGFTVGGTGNADNDTFTQTVVAAKSTVSQAYLTKLIQILNADYDVSPTTGKLDSTDSSDVVVTIGTTTK